METVIKYCWLVLIVFLICSVFPDLIWARPAPPYAEDGRVIFEYNSQTAKNVTVAGDFNGWNPGATKLNEISSGHFKKGLELDPGKYKYKYVIDGQWMSGEDLKVAVERFNGKVAVDYESQRFRFPFDSRIIFHGNYLMHSVFSEEMSGSGTIRSEGARHDVDLNFDFKMEKKLQGFAQLRVNSENSDKFEVDQAWLTAHLLQPEEEKTSLDLTGFRHTYQLDYKNPLRFTDEYRVQPVDNVYLTGEERAKKYHLGRYGQGLHLGWSNSWLNSSLFALDKLTINHEPSDADLFGLRLNNRSKFFRIGLTNITESFSDGARAGPAGDVGGEDASISERNIADSEVEEWEFPRGSDQYKRLNKFRILSPDGTNLRSRSGVDMRLNLPAGFMIFTEIAYVRDKFSAVAYADSSQLITVSPYYSSDISQGYGFERIIGGKSEGTEIIFGGNYRGGDWGTEFSVRMEDLSAKTLSSAPGDTQIHTITPAILGLNYKLRVDESSERSWYLTWDVGGKIRSGVDCPVWYRESLMPEFYRFSDFPYVKNTGHTRLFTGFSLYSFGLHSRVYYTYLARTSKREALAALRWYPKVVYNYSNRASWEMGVRFVSLELDEATEFTTPFAKFKYEWSPGLDFYIWGGVDENSIYRKQIGEFWSARQHFFRAVNSSGGAQKTQAEVFRDAEKTLSEQFRAGFFVNFRF